MGCVLRLSRWLAIAVIGVGTASTGALADDAYVVGVISPMTGVMAATGVTAEHAIEWWANDVNASGGINGRKVRLDICDDRGNPETAVTCARRQKELGVPVILDVSVSSTIRAITPMLADGPVMVITSPIIDPDPNGFVFRVLPSDLDITKALLHYLQESNVNKLAMIASTDTTGEIGVQDARAVFPPAGVDLSLSRIDLKANDASIQLANVMKDNPIIYCGYSGTGAATVLKNFTDLGLNVPFVLSAANLNDAFMSLIKDSMPQRLMAAGFGLALPNFVKSPEERARIARFTTSYEAAWKGEKVSVLTLQALLPADTAEAVLRNVKDLSDAKAVKAYIESNPIESLLPMHFSPQKHTGLGPDAASVMDYKDGRWVQADPLH